MRKKWTQMRRDRRADIGIGTMIVFIAMVLVAAVAAAVLIQTANSVREQATSTGDQTINNVASGFLKEGVVGHVDSTSFLMDGVNITLRLAAGSPNIYMNNVVVKVLYGTQDITLTYCHEADPTDWNAEYRGDLKFEAQSGFTSDHTVKAGDLLNIRIGGGGTAPDQSLDLALDNLQNIKIQVFPGFGQPTLIDVTTPEVYLGTYVSLS
jgi:flagellin FlaB